MKDDGSIRFEVGTREADGRGPVDSRRKVYGGRSLERPVHLVSKGEEINPSSGDFCLKGRYLFAKMGIFRDDLVESL